MGKNEKKKKKNWTSTISQGQEAKPCKLQVVPVSEDLSALTVLLHTLLHVRTAHGSLVCHLPLGYCSLPVFCISSSWFFRQKRDYFSPRAKSIITFSCEIFVKVFFSLKSAWIFSCGLAVNQLGHRCSVFFSFHCFFFFFANSIFWPSFIWQLSIN